jgi:type I restriction enzyme, S subunit
MTEFVMLKDWINTTLDSVVDTIVGGGTPSKSNPEFYSGTIPWMTVKDMNKHVLVDTIDHITQSAIESSSTNVIPSGTPIVATRMSLGKVVIANFDSAINQDLKALFVNGNVDKGFFVYWYRSISKLIESLGTGTTVKGVRLEILKGLSFPLAPAAEQKQIAAKLDELLAQVDSIKTRLDAIPAILKRFRQSVLAAAVSGRLTEEWRENTNFRSDIKHLTDTQKTRRGVPEKVSSPEILNGLNVPDSWAFCSAAELLRKGVIIDLKDGNHGANHPKSAEFTPDGIPFITAAQVTTTNTIDYNGAPKVSGIPLSKLKVGFSHPGDVIFTHKGTVGRVAINTQECVLTPQTTYYRVHDKYLSHQYLQYYLLSNIFGLQIDDIKSQTTRDFVPITAQYSLYHLLPPLEEQTEIVCRVEQLFTFADQIEQRVKDAQSRVNHLTQSILAKAFRGELTAEWRERNLDLITGENSAQALLARIKAEQANLKPKKKARKKSAA